MFSFIHIAFPSQLTSSASSHQSSFHSNLVLPNFSSTFSYDPSLTPIALVSLLLPLSTYFLPQLQFHRAPVKPPLTLIHHLEGPPELVNYLLYTIIILLYTLPPSTSNSVFSTSHPHHIHCHGLTLIVSFFLSFILQHLSIIFHSFSYFITSFKFFFILDEILDIISGFQNFKISQDILGMEGLIVGWEDWFNCWLGRLLHCMIYSIRFDNEFTRLLMV